MTEITTKSQPIGFLSGASLLKPSRNMRPPAIEKAINKV